jgi:hypothetical protein
VNGCGVDEVVERGCDDRVDEVGSGQRCQVAAAVDLREVPVRTGCSEDRDDLGDGSGCVGGGDDMLNDNDARRGIMPPTERRARERVPRLSLAS